MDEEKAMPVFVIQIIVENGMIFLTKIFLLIYIYQQKRDGYYDDMTAKVFENGRNQAVRLPKEYRFNTDEVAVNRIGDIVMLMPKTNKWNSFMQAIDMFSEDFMDGGRTDEMMQEREDLGGFQDEYGFEFLEI